MKALLASIDQYFHLVLFIMPAVQGGSNFYVSRWNPSVWPFKWKLVDDSALNNVLPGNN